MVSIKYFLHIKLVDVHVSWICFKVSKVGLLVACFDTRALWVDVLFR